ncbi:hypothetical protein SPD48_05460 [Pseudogracilibacillus sp. SE30717A]|uniref:hypothetical protein n=1 Tax=Pseudogracilibacillus sp. SE30717A TaxID=3098293 RepID=UPI00300E1AFC
MINTLRNDRQALIDNENCGMFYSKDKSSAARNEKNTDEVEEQQKVIQAGWREYKLVQHNNQHFVLYDEIRF